MGRIENDKHVSEAPVTREGDGRMSDSVTTHPAFGQIGACRTQGQATLYGSDFKHQNFVVITISRSELHRGLSNDHHFAREQLIEVALSEAQWASFVSCMNVGDGVPCTIESIDGVGVPSIELTEPVADKFAAEMDQTLLDIQAALRKLEANEKLPQWLRKEIGIQAGRLTGSTGFVAAQFSEHIENAIEKARIEVNAYTLATIQRAGLAALGAGPPIELIAPPKATEELP